MWKYCVEINWFWMRRYLDKRKWEIGYAENHFDYVEQRYFRTKAEAKKGYAAAIRESREMLNERKALVDDCHEKVIKECYENKRFFGIINRYFRGPVEDEIWISLEKVSD